MNDDECIRVWKSRLGNSFDRTYRVFERFYDEVLSGHAILGGMSVSEIVEWQAKAVERKEKFLIRNLAHDWINKQRLTIGSKTTRLGQISSLFLHNQAPLPPDPSFHFSSDVAPVDGNLTLDCFQKILHNCNKMYRAVFLMQFHMGGGEGDVVFVSDNRWREVLNSLSKNVGVFKISLPGRKQNRNKKNFYTMLDSKSDWGDAYREYMLSRSRMPKGCLFRNNYGEPLNVYDMRSYFHDHAVQSGIIKPVTPVCSECHGETVKRVRKYKGGVKKTCYVCKECGNVDWACEMDTQHLKCVRYGVNPHEIRDLFRSRWQVSGADPLVAEFMMQHEIDVNQYNKFMKYEAWYPIQEYRKALPWLNILSCDPQKIDRSEVGSEINELRETLLRQSKQMNEMQRDQAIVRKIAERLHDPDALERFLKKLEE